MTKNSPRIYTYKITFEEVPYYYYGAHKEKRFNDYYMGSPVTHKWMWDFYTPKKQILQFFEFNDAGWLEAQEIEKRIIRPFLNDKWGLNENCGNIFSLTSCSKAGKIGGNKTKELGLGICGLTPEKRSEFGKIGGKVGGEKAKELKLGFHAYTTEERKALGKKCYDEGKGIASLTKEQLGENAKKADEFNRKNKIGFYAITPEQRRETVSKTNSQRWECCETGYITTPGALTKYQRARGIDTSNRKRIV